MTSICGFLSEAPLSKSRERLEALASDASDPELLVEPEGAVAGPRGATYGDGRYLIAWSGDAFEPDPGRAYARGFSERGPRFLAELRDDVALAILDRERRQLLLALDRFGVRTLYFCETPSGIVFASTGRSLGAHPEVPREVDPQAVFDYVYFHVVPSPRGIFKGWERLEPAQYVLFRNGEIERARYWQPRYAETSPASEAELVGEFRATTRRAVEHCVTGSSGKVGAFLSGGTDSSTVSGLLGEITGEPANTYSIGFDVPGYDESTYAQIAVRHFGTNHHEYVVTPDDVLDLAPKLAEAYEEPFGNASAVASYYCARLAKEDGVQTLLGGDGGDEIFAGNERYAKQKIFERYLRLPSPLRRGLIEPLLDALPDNGVPLIGKARSYVRQARTPLPDRIESYNLLRRLGPENVFAPDFLARIRTDEPLELLRKTYAEAPTRSVLNRLLYLDLKFTLADNDLRKVGGTCDMAGVSVRYPFLVRELVDFANRVPPDLKLEGQKLRYFFKKASAGFLPKEILDKSKHGFGVPCGLWMREHPELKELAHESLSALDRRGYLQPSFVAELRALHRGGHGNYYGVMVWVLTMLELWHQHHAP